MTEEVKYNNTLVSGRADETLTYTKYVKDESSGKSTKELLDEKVNKTDQLGTTQIADKAVTNEKLAEHSVDKSKLSPDSVSYDKIQNDAVITEKIQDNAVTTEKVKEKAITNTKLGDQSVDGRVVREASLETKHFANESVTAEKVARKSITKDKLADNAVDASQVVDGSIGNAKLSSDSVTTEKIKDSSVTNEKVADNTLGIEKFDPELRKTIQAATGLPDDLTQMIQDVDKSVKKLKENDTDLQSQINDKQQQITANKSAQDTKNASLDENMKKLNTRDDQITETLKNISTTGGASVASAVTYDNTTSQLTSANIQGAVDELQGAKIDKTSILQELGEAEDKVMSQKAVSDKLSDLSVPSIKGNFLIYPYFVLESNPSQVPATNDSTLHVLYFRPLRKKYITDILKKSILRGIAYLYKGTFANKTYIKSIMFDDSKDNPTIDLSNETEDFDFVLINYKDENKKWADGYKYAQYNSIQDEELSKSKLDKSSVSQETGDEESKVMSQKVVTNNLLALSSIKGEFLIYPKFVLESDPRKIQPQGDSSLNVLYFKPQKRKYITDIKSNNLIRGLMYLYKGTMSNFTYVKSIMFETKDNLTIDLSNETEDFDFALINYKDENKKWEDHFRYAQYGSVQDEELSEELLGKIDKIEKWKDFTIYPYFVLESNPSRVLATTDGILHVFYFSPKKEKYMTNILEKNIYRGLAYLYKGTFENRVYVKSISFEVKDNPILDFSNETSEFDFVLINYKDDNKKWEDSYKYAQYQEEELSKRISNNQWYGKKICIIGTSVAHGSNAETAYGYIAQQRLGFSMIPAGVPGQAIHGKIVSYTKDGAAKKILSPLIYGSGVLTKAEYSAAKAVKDAGLSTDVIGMGIPDSPSNPSNWAGEGKPYNNYYRTWENLFTEKNKDVALWIYATIPNNNNYSLDDWNNFNTSKWAYKDGTAFEDHRTTFLGAMLYLMDKMYSVQPTARMVLVIDSEFNYELGKNNFKLLSETYNIPIIDLWSKINTSPKSLLQLKSFNGTNSHPSTFGHEMMGNIFTNELLLIS